MSEASKIRDWMFRCLQFEADAQHFRSAGIRIGVDSSSFERHLFEESLAPFPIPLRNESLRMARVYALMNAFENSVRDLVKQRLMQKHGIDWWQSGVSPSIRKHADSRKIDYEKNSWLRGENSELISFLDFGHLTQIIVNNWEAFSDLMPNQHWLKQRMDELEKARNFIAHNRPLAQSEYARIEMYIADWTAQVGV